MACRLLLAVCKILLLLLLWLVLAMWTGLTGFVCKLACNSGAIGDEKHMIFECAAMAPLRQQHADLSHLKLTPCAPFSLSRITWGF